MLPWIASAKAGEPGHPTYVVPTQGAGRVDNPEHYLVLYASDAPAGAVAEAFGNHALWSEALLAGPPALPGSVRAVARYSLDVEVLDLDDPKHLVARDLRPSRVVTRRRDVTQAWALSVYDEGRWAGVRWWGFHNSDWGSFGIWDLSDTVVDDVEPLTVDHPAVIEATSVLARRWERARRPRRKTR